MASWIVRGEKYVNPSIILLWIFIKVESPDDYLVVGADRANLR
jgi:hypothetical protein